MLERFALYWGLFCKIQVTAYFCKMWVTAYRLFASAELLLMIFTATGHYILCWKQKFIWSDCRFKECLQSPPEFRPTGRSYLCKKDLPYAQRIRKPLLHVFSQSVCMCDLKGLAIVRPKDGSVGMYGYVMMNVNYRNPSVIGPYFTPPLRN